MAKLTDRIQNAGTEVVEAKAGAGSATLSMVCSSYCVWQICKPKTMEHGNASGHMLPGISSLLHWCRLRVTLLFDWGTSRQESNWHLSPDTIHAMKQAAGL